MEFATMMFGIDRLKGECSEVPRKFEAYRAWFLADACVLDISSRSSESSMR